jgi:hypothetical protein
MLLLVLTLATGSVAPVRGQQEDAPTDEEKITPEEEREAVQLAERFIKRFEEKNEPSSLIDELYVKDFDARLRRDDVSNYIYLVKVEPEVVAKATDQDLRRLYTASLNFIYASAYLYGIHMYNRKLKGLDAVDDDNDPPLKEILPPQVEAVLRSDPVMAKLLAEDEEQEREGNSEPSEEPQQRAAGSSEKEAKADGVEIRSVERMRGFASTLEKAAVLVREHLKTLQVPQTWKELLTALQTMGAWEGVTDDCEGLCPRVNIISDEFFGAPVGTRLICVKVMPFHMDLVRVDGRLRILNVYMMGN